MSNVKAVARAVIERASARGRPITNLQLQKLIYFAHGFLLAKHGKPLVRDEKFQAWKYGPVLEPLYHDLKIFGPSSIGPSDGFIPHWPCLPKNSELELAAIDAVLDQLGSMTSGALIDFSHDPRGPWHAVFKANSKNICIEDKAIADYFKTIVK